ncbi:MAG: DUF4397 domain-containing protein [Candidatus Sumerlaeaceae bacterium]
MVTRSLTLPLLAVIAATLTRAGAAGDGIANEQVSITRGIGPDKARLAFVHAIAGADKVDLLGDGRVLRRNVSYGRRLKPQSLRAEGYSLDVDAAKVGLPYIDAFTADLQGGRDYTFVAYGNTESSSPTLGLLVDVPGLLVPKDTVQLLFTNASPDSLPADLLIDGQVLYSGVASGSFQGPQPMDDSKHEVEVRINGLSVVGPTVKKFKHRETINLVLYGTALGEDGKPLQLLSSEMKSR